MSLLLLLLEKWVEKLSCLLRIIYWEDQRYETTSILWRFSVSLAHKTLYISPFNRRNSLSHRIKLKTDNPLQQFTSIFGIYAGLRNIRKKKNYSQTLYGVPLPYPLWVFLNTFTRMYNRPVLEAIKILTNNYNLQWDDGCGLANLLATILRLEDLKSKKLTK